MCTDNLIPSHIFLVLKFNPKSWPGENGKAASLTKSEESQKAEKFKLNQFNLIATDKIALNRSLPDVRLDQYVAKTLNSRLIRISHSDARKRGTQRSYLPQVLSLFFITKLGLRCYAQFIV